MDWNKYLAKGYKALDNAHLHFNVEGGTFEFDNDRDARQGATILGRIYGFDNVIQSGFNVIVCEPEEEIEETLKEGVTANSPWFKKGMWYFSRFPNTFAFVCGYTNPKTHQKVAVLKGFQDEKEFREFVNKLVNDTKTPDVEVMYASKLSDYYRAMHEDFNDAPAIDVAKRIAKALKLNRRDFDMLVHDINNLRGDEWLEQVESIGDEELLKQFKEVAQLDLEETIEKHGELNPKLFEGNELKPEVKEALIKVVDAFVEDLKDSEVDIKVKDAIVIGSNVNYNYTKDSDIDLHIIADSDISGVPGELLTLLYSAYRSIFNKNYDITIKGIPCEVYVEMDELHGVSNGAYSLYSGWLKEPEQKNIPDLDEEAFNKLFGEWEDKYFALLDEIGITPEEMFALKETEENLEASEKVYDFIEDIYDLRKESIASEGEFGLGNLVFKEFRNLGYLDALKALTKVLKGRELSLENMNEDFSQDTLEAIYQSTLDNNGGTFDLRTGKSLSGDDRVKNVYSVEFKSKDWRKRVGQVDRTEVVNAIMTLMRSDEAENADAIGTWSSGENERPQSSVGLDKFFKDREEAEKFALEHDQKAIGVFDGEGNYSDTIYKRDFKYKPKKKVEPKEQPKEEPKVEPQEQDKEEK